MYSVGGAAGSARALAELEDRFKRGVVGAVEYAETRARLLGYAAPGSIDEAAFTDAQSQQQQAVPSSLTSTLTVVTPDEKKKRGGSKKKKEKDKKKSKKSSAQQQLDISPPKNFRHVATLGPAAHGSAESQTDGAGPTAEQMGLMRRLSKKGVFGKSTQRLALATAAAAVDAAAALRPVSYRERLEHPEAHTALPIIDLPLPSGGEAGKRMTYRAPTPRESTADKEIALPSGDDAAAVADALATAANSAFEIACPLLPEIAMSSLTPVRLMVLLLPLLP